MTKITVTSELIVSLLGKDMSLSALLNFRTLQIQNAASNERTASAITFSDVKRFLDAAKPGDFNDLLDDYSSASLPLFGLSEDTWSDQSEPSNCETADDPTTVVDCRNMAMLLRCGLMLCRFADDANTEYDDLEEAGLIIHEEGNQDDQASIGIRLEVSPETRRFLNRGLALLPPSIEFLWLADSGEMLELWLANDSLGTHNNAASLMCEALLNRLSDLILLDVSVRIQRRSSVAVSHSPASSLWLAMLAGSLSGRVGLCETCGKPYVAKKERGQRRKTCSPRCRKALSIKNKKQRV